MKPTRNQVVGDLGETEADANFQRIGWAPSIKFRQDIGDDLMTVARDDRGTDLGLPVVYQVKASHSSYEKPTATKEGEPGWWYEDSDPRHFDHWVKHGLPQLLVLHDLSARVSHWVHVTGDRVESTGVGSKIFVPAGQVVDEENLPALLEVAASTRARISLEGSAWTGALAEIGPSERLRYALIAPRLVAPHGNQHRDSLNAHQGVALIAGVRLGQYQRACQEGHAPWPPAMREHREWAWRFAGGVYDLLLGKGTDQMESLLAQARHSHEVVAARVVTGCWLWEGERHEAALSMLSVPSDASDADTGWLLAQRARVLASIERVDEAVVAAQESLERLALLTDDPTASALRSSAVWTLYSASAFGSGDFGRAIAASDNAVSWWRSQQVLRGLALAGEDRFESQFRSSQRTTFGRAEDRGHNHLTGALWNAAFAADHAGWKSAAKTLAVHTFTVQIDQTDGSLQESLSLLRRGGHSRELGDAVRRLWEAGPTGLLRDLANNRSARNQTYEEERATLAIWKWSGDLLPTERADAAINECLELVSSPDSVAHSPYGGASFRLHDVVPAVGRLLPAASSDAYGRVASYLAENLAVNSIAAQSLRPLVAALPLEDPAIARHLDAIRVGAQRLDNYQGHLILAQLAEKDHQSRDEIARLASAGNRTAARARIGLGIATDNELTAFVERQQQSVHELVERSKAAAARGEKEHTFGADDPLAELAWSAQRVGSDEGLRLVVKAILSPEVPDDAKLESIWILTASCTHFDLDFQAWLRAKLTLTPLPTNDLAPHLALRTVSGAIRPDDARSEVIRLMRSRRVEDRVGAALVVGHSQPADGLALLTGLMSDASPQVRATASSCVVAYGERSVDAASHAELLLRTALEQDGYLVARTMAQSIRDQGAAYNSIRETLSRSASALVRTDLAR